MRSMKKLIQRLRPGYRALIDEGMVGRFWGRAGSGILFYDRLRHTYLLLKRSEEVLDPGLWGIPGGAVPHNTLTGRLANPWESAKRETAEETGRVVHDSIEYERRFEVQAPHSTFIYTTYVVVMPEFVPELNWESDDYVWLKLDEALAMSDLHPGVRPVLEQLNKPRG